MIRSRSLAAAAAAALVAVSLVFAHVDDPKATSIEPAYAGPGYRAAEGGVAGVEFPAQGVTLLSWVPLGEFETFSGESQPSANDIWGYTSPSGREYAIIGLENGTAWVEITDPTDAQIIAYESGPGSIWRDMRTYQGYSYSVTEAGNGIQVFDLTDIDNGNVSHVTNITTGGSEASHNVALNEDSGYLYRCGGSGNGLRIYSLDNPAAPQFVASWPDRYVHDVHVVSYTEGPYAGKEIAFACSGLNGGWDNPGIDIVDVTDKADIQVMATYEYPEAVYSHQGWLSDNKQYFFLGDELDEGTFDINSKMIVIDVSDLENPFQATTFSNASTAVTHNLFAVGDIVLAANYSSGLRIFDVSSPLATAEIGYFDTDPDNDNADYSNLWGAYPFFESGTVIGSDRSLGLFVWDVDAIGDPEPQGDVNGDGFINVLDLVAMITTWGPCHDCPADLNGDDVVDVLDLVILITNWS